MSREKSAVQRILDEPGNAPVIRKLVVTTLAMILLPVAIFFGVRSAAGSVLHMESGGANLWGGIAAAVTVNVIMVFYVFLAWNEKLEDAPAQDVKKTL